jgi:CHAD domain-containing protein
MALVSRIVSSVIRLDISLLHCVERLRAQTDDEALHDLRINIRKLRSLLYPIRGQDDVDLLSNMAAAVGQLTTPVRDLEVLITDLQARGLNQAMQVRKATLPTRYQIVLNDSRVHCLLAHLEKWPAAYRTAALTGELNGLPKTVTNRFHKQIEKLRNALASPEHDPHQIRLLVKRLRYSSESYPSLAPVRADAQALLKELQAALGDWHDRFQWLSRSKEELDLLEVVAAWRAESNAALEAAELIIQRLKQVL